MTRSTSAEVWAAGEAYEPYVGRWSRLVAREFLHWLGSAEGLRWLDVGCGTGALTQVILDTASPALVEAIDQSDGFVQFARRQASDERATFAVADARLLPQRDGSMDAVVSGLALNFIPQPDVALREMARVARAGGVVAVYVWDYAGAMELMRYFWDAAVALDPGAAQLDEGPRFPICKPTALEALFRDTHLRDVASRAIDVPTRFRNFDDYWMPFLGGQGPAPAYAMSLTEERRGALRERLRAALPIAADGSIDLMARAWVARGTRP